MNIRLGSGSMTKSPSECIRRTNDAPASAPKGSSVKVIPAVNTYAKSAGCRLRRWADNSWASGKPSLLLSTAAAIPCIRAAPLASASVNRSDSSSTSTPRARSRAANASCSSCARATHGSPSNSRASLLRGVRRVSSAPGLCRMTARRVPTSESTPNPVTASTVSPTRGNAWRAGLSGCQLDSTAT